MKHTQKGALVPILIAIIALLVIGGGYYLVQNKDNQNVIDDVTPLNVTNETKQPAQPSQSQPATSSPAGAATITLRTPNNGSRLVKGTTHKIIWDSSAAFKAAYPQVSITLITAQGQQAVTPQQRVIRKNTGIIEWDIPTAVLSGYIQDTPGGPYTMRTLDDQTEFQFFIEGYPHTTGRAEGPFDYSDGSFRIVSE